MTVLYTRSNAIIGRLIRLFSKKATHVGFSTELHGLPVVIHSDLEGVVVVSRARFLRGRMLVGEFRLLRDGTKALIAVVDLLGEPYDKFGIIGQAIARVARFLGRVIKNPLHSPRALVCSELGVRMALADPDLAPEWAALDPELTSPTELWDAQTARSFASV